MVNTMYYIASFLIPFRYNVHDNNSRYIWNPKVHDLRSARKEIHLQSRNEVENHGKFLKVCWKKLLTYISFSSFQRRIKQNEVFKCLFEEGTNRQDFAHSYIKPFSNGSHQPFNELKCPDCIRFSKRGLQKPKLPDKCANFIIKKLDNECAHSHKTFCDHMRKFKHRLNLASNIRDLCKFNKTSS